MKTCSRCKEDKPISEFTKRRASKDGYTSACTQCLKKQKRIDYLCEPEKTMERVKRNEKIRLKKDPAYRRAWQQWRYAKELGRVPGWVKFSRDLLPRYRELLGKYPTLSIGHIIPLQGRNVCGLHVPTNLQALPYSDNSSKWNHFHPDLLPLYDI